MHDVFEVRGFEIYYFGTLYAVITKEADGHSWAHDAGRELCSINDEYNEGDEGGGDVLEPCPHCGRQG